MIKHIVFLSLLCLSGYLYWAERTITHGPGVVAPAEPAQQPAFGVDNFNHKGFDIKPLADFEAEARVLSRKRYSDRLADVAPMDFLLGWGPMSDERNLNEIFITQSDRYFNWQMTKRPIPLHQMVRHTANIHIAASTPEIQQQLREVRNGHIIKLKGHLVRLSTSDGWSLESSLNRKDYGDGASEILWVEEFQIL